MNRTAGGTNRDKRVKSEAPPSAQAGGLHPHILLKLRFAGTMSAIARKCCQAFGILAKIGAVLGTRCRHAATGVMRTFLRFRRRFRHFDPPQPSSLIERRSSMLKMSGLTGRWRIL